MSCVMLHSHQYMCDTALSSIHVWCCTLINTCVMLHSHQYMCDTSLSSWSIHVWYCTPINIYVILHYHEESAQWALQVQPKRFACWVDTSVSWNNVNIKWYMSWRHVDLMSANPCVLSNLYEVKSWSFVLQHHDSYPTQHSPKFFTIENEYTIQLKIWGKPVQSSFG